MFCKNCGNEIKDGVKFCGKCGALQDVSTLNSIKDIKKIIRKKPFIFIIAIFIIALIIIVITVVGNSPTKSSMETVNEKNEIVTEASKYQKTNSYGITCNGNSDLAIEAANVFANKYGESGHDWTLTSVDASVSGMNGTYRYSYNWAGNSYTATTNFKITDYGSYRNYTWDGDFADLFYGN